MIGTAKLVSLAGGLIARARESVEPVADRIATIRYDPPPVRLTHLVIIGLAWPLSLWAWGKWCERSQDGIWRARIAASSSAVRSEIAKGRVLAEMTDTDIIKGLSDADDQLKSAEQALDAYRNAPRPPERDRCRIPAECLRQQ